MNEKEDKQGEDVKGDNDNEKDNRKRKMVNRWIKSGKNKK